MGKNFFYGLLMCTVLFSLSLSAFGQGEATSVRGNISGTVVDASGAVIPGAQVTAVGPAGQRTARSDENGRFLIQLVPPGAYTVTVKVGNFQTQQASGVMVETGKTSNVAVKLQAGATETVIEVRADASTVDVSSTAVGTSLNDIFFQAVPTNRNVASLFTFAPGVVSGGGTGGANPSIGGASGLENLYLADGVNITSQAFGGLGVYTQLYGSVGTGINLSFIKEVNVKTGAFQPQYGQMNGGVVQIVTKTGSEQYHGALSAYAAPYWARSTAKYTDDQRIAQIGKLFDNSSYELSGELGGYIPGLKKHLFFFGSVDPTYTRNNYAPPIGNGLSANNPLGVCLPNGTTVCFNQLQRTNTYNYDGKLTFKLNDSNTIEGSVFGDPAHTNTGRVLGKTLAVKNATGWSKWEYGTRNEVARYNGALSPTWLVNGSFTYNNNNFIETPSQDVFQIVDRTTATTSTLQGFGALLNHQSKTWAVNVDTSKIFKAWGSHEVSIGFGYERPEYVGIRARSGGFFTVVPSNINGGAYATASNGVPSPVGVQTNAQFNLFKASALCTACTQILVNGVLTPVEARTTRGEFGVQGGILTHSEYMSGFANDNWTMNKYVTLSLGMRWEQQYFAGTTQQYEFRDNWSPRLGITVDPVGDRKSKLFVNFARYSYPLALDAALRQLSSELDLLGTDYVPIVTGGQVTGVDISKVLSGTPGIKNRTTLASGGEPIVNGTKMNYEDEWVIGGERQIKGLIVSARYIDRRLKRIVEDVGSVSPESPLGQQSLIANPSPTLDVFNNEKQTLIPGGTPFDPITGAMTGFPACNVGDAAGTIASNVNGDTSGVTSNLGPSSDANGNQISPSAICIIPALPGGQPGTIGSDGLSDGFVAPIRNYTAFEFEVNKSFSNNYLFRANYRYAKLFGNYEGAFRNDNGQSDPGISSLFDFTTGQFNLLGNQFAPGYLNTDRRHVVNGFFSYTFDKHSFRGLTLGTSVRVQQGIPLNILGNHPVYQNSGEVPLGGRGSAGRTPTTGTVDLRMDYPQKISERFALHYSVDLFNIMDARRLLNQDQNNAQGGLPVGSNPDFGKPSSSFLGSYQQPFFARFAVRLTF